MNQRLFVNGDVSFNGKMAVLGPTVFINDVSINQRLYVIGNVSFNNFNVLGDVSINRRLNINNDVSMNSRLFISNDVSLNSKIYVKGDAFMNNRLFTDNLNLSISNNIFTLNALNGNKRFSNDPNFGFSGGSALETNVPNFNIFFSLNNQNTNNYNNLDLYVDNPRNNLVLGQQLPSSSLYNIYSTEDSNIYSSFNFSNNLAIASYALSNISSSYDSTNNVAIGTNSLNYLSDGHCNTAIGSGSMVNLGINTWSSTGASYNNSISIPRNVGQNYLPSASNDNDTSNFNTAVGYFSMSSNNIFSSSNKNTVLGALAFSDTFDSISSSPVSQHVYTQNTFIGYNTQPMSNVYSNQIVLGTSTETTYIPGKFSVISDTSLNGKLFVNGDLSLNGRLFIKNYAFSNDSIPITAISGLTSTINSLVISAMAGSSSPTSSIVQSNEIPLYSSSFLNTINLINNTTVYNWFDIVVSMTGQYQTAIESYGNIYYSNDFGNTWNKGIISISNVSLGTNLINWTSVTMSYSGKTQIASAILPTTVLPSQNIPYSYIFSSSNYGINWILTFSNTISYSSTINSLAISSDGQYQYASIFQSSFLSSTNYGINWSSPVLNNLSNQVGNWLAISTSSNGQYVCIGGIPSNIVFSNNYGASLNTISNIGMQNINSISMSYSGQYIIISSGSFSGQTGIFKTNSSGTIVRNNGYLYLSSDYGNSFNPLYNATYTVWLSVRISGNGQYIIGLTQSDNSDTPGNPGSIWYSFDYGNSWYKNNSYIKKWMGVSISSTGQYITFISPNDAIYTSNTSYYDHSFLGTLNTNNVSINGTLDVTGYCNPLEFNDGSIINTALLSLDYVNNLCTFWTNYASSFTNYSYNNSSMSYTGQYQSVVSNSYILISKNFGITWNKTSYGFSTSSNYSNTWINTNLGWTNICMSGSGKYQYAIPFFNTSYSTSFGNLSSYIFRSSSYGDNWQNIYINNINYTNTFTSNSNTAWNSISTSSSGQYICAAGDLTHIYLSSNYGNDWYISNTITNVTNKIWSSLSMSSSGKYIYATAIANNGSAINYTNITGFNLFSGELIYVSNNFGNTWYTSTITGGTTIIGSNTNYRHWQYISSSSNGQYAYACSSYLSGNPIRDGNIFYTTNYGVDFIVSNSGNDYWQSISTSSSGQYVVATSQSSGSTNGFIYSSYDYGINWTKRVNGTPTQCNATSAAFNGICISSNGQYINACATNGIYSSTTSIPYLNIANNLNVGGQVTAASFNATSDQRIKHNINKIDNYFALDTIRKIKPVSYELIDKTTNSNSILGFIAQEVQSILDYTVSKNTNYIPNIYEIVTINKKTVILNEKFTTDISLCHYPTKLKFKDFSDNVIYNTIDQIIDSKTFTLIEPIDSSIDYLFLYGQEVNDYLSINYDSIFTVTTTAVKQIDIELQEAKQTIKDQSNTINNLQNDISILKSQMSNLLNLLNNK